MDSNFKRIYKGPSRGCYVGASEADTSEPDSKGEYYFLCHNLRSERNSCLPQALNIAFGQNIFISKKDYINQIGEFYKEAIDEKLNVFNWSAQELRVNGISWKWSNLADSNQFVHSQLSNDEIKRLLVKEISDFTTDNIGKFKQNQW